MKISMTVNKFIASNEKFDASDIIRHQFFIYLALSGTIISIILTGLVGFFRPDIFISLQLFITLFIFSAASLWSYKNNGKLNHCSNILLTGLFLTGLGASMSYLSLIHI